MCVLIPRERSRCSFSELWEEWEWRMAFNIVKCLTMVQKLNFRSLLLKIVLRKKIIMITLSSIIIIGTEDCTHVEVWLHYVPTSVCFACFFMYLILQSYKLLERGAMFHAEYFHAEHAHCLAYAELHSVQPIFLPQLSPSHSHSFYH